MTGRVEAALAAIRRGELVVVVDGEDRENEGDLIMAAELARPETVAFMVRHTSGVLCVGLPEERADELDLPLMVTANQDSFGTAFTVSIDWKHGTSTGISAADRAATIRALVNPLAQPTDFARPGHIFPLRAKPGGVLQRPGHTEASVDLARLAGLAPAGVLAEVVNDDGTMARRPQLERFAAEHGLVLVTIEDLIAYRNQTERLVVQRSMARLETDYGLADVVVFESQLDGVEHATLVYGDLGGDAPVLVRIHSECLTGDVLGSQRCDCGAQLDAAQRRIVAAGRGVVVYLRGHEGRGIGLAAKVAAYRLQEEGFDTVEANVALGLPVDARNYDVAAHILKELGVTSVKLLTNNPDKVDALAVHGLRVDRVALCPPPSPYNQRYITTKQDKLGHLDDDSARTRVADVVPRYPVTTWSW